MAIMSVLAVGISSAVVISIRTVETSGSRSTRVRQAADVSNQLTAEIGGAIDVPQRSGTSVTFSVADRNGDGLTEQIQYAWSGTAGDALLRTYNSESPAAILTNVHQFLLGYDMISVLVPDTGADLLAAGHHASSDLSSAKIGNLVWVSQSFRPDLPTGAVSWKPTRAIIYARYEGDTAGQVTVQVCSALSDGRPGSTVYYQGTIAESEIGKDYSWKSISLSGTSSFSPTARLSCVVKSTIKDSCELRYHHKNVTIPDYTFSTTSTAGGSWTVNSGQGLLFELYATVSGISGDQQTDSRLGLVRWQLQSGTDATARVYGAAQTRNLPE